MQISFSADSTAIVLRNIAPVALLQLKNNLQTDSSYQSLVSVLQTPAEDDSLSMEIEWPGELLLQGDTLLFKPNQDFVKGKLYRVETVLNSHFGTTKDILKAQVGKHLKVQQEVLTR